MVHTSLIPKYCTVPTADQVAEDLNANLPPHASPITAEEVETMFDLARFASSNSDELLQNINWVICLTYDRHCD